VPRRFRYLKFGHLPRTQFPIHTLLLHTTFVHFTHTRTHYTFCFLLHESITIAVLDYTCPHVPLLPRWPLHTPRPLPDTHPTRSARCIRTRARSCSLPHPYLPAGHTTRALLPAYVATPDVARLPFTHMRTRRTEGLPTPYATYPAVVLRCSCRAATRIPYLPTVLVAAHCVVRTPSPFVPVVLLCVGMPAITGLVVWNELPTQAFACCLLHTAAHHHVALPLPLQTRLLPHLRTPGLITVLHTAHCHTAPCLPFPIPFTTCTPCRTRTPRLTVPYIHSSPTFLPAFASLPHVACLPHLHLPMPASYTHTCPHTPTPSTHPRFPTLMPAHYSRTPPRYPHTLPTTIPHTYRSTHDITLHTLLCNTHIHMPAISTTAGPLGPIYL